MRVNLNEINLICYAFFITIWNSKMLNSEMVHYHSISKFDILHSYSSSFYQCNAQHTENYGLTKAQNVWQNCISYSDNIFVQCFFETVRVWNHKWFPLQISWNDSFHKFKTKNFFSHINNHKIFLELIKNFFSEPT